MTYIPIVSNFPLVHYDDSDKPSLWAVVNMPFFTHASDFEINGDSNMTDIAGDQNIHWHGLGKGCIITVGLSDPTLYMSSRWPGEDT